MHNLKKVEPLSLALLSNDYSISEFPIGTFNNIDFQAGILSLVFERDRISIIHETQKNIAGHLMQENDWKAIRIEGSFDFEISGILSNILSPLSKACISVLVYSSYDTDYILVKRKDIKKAISELKLSGFYISSGKQLQC